MKRFFYSGCSFTKYGYPTWGDIIAYDLITTGKIDYSVNLASGGGCNYYIYHSFLRADAKYKFTDDDIMGVCWTTPWRHSLLCKFSKDSEELDLDTVWQTHGNVVNHPIWPHINNHLDYINTNAYLVERTVSSMLALNKMYDFSFQIKMPTFEPFLDGELDLEIDKDQDLNDYIMQGYNKFLGVPSFEYNYDRHRPPHLWLFEGHPTIKQHLSQARKLYDISDDTITEMTRLDVIFNQAMNSIVKNPSDKPDFHDWQNTVFSKELEKILTTPGFNRFNPWDNFLV